MTGINNDTIQLVRRVMSRYGYPSHGATKYYGVSLHKNVWTVNLALGSKSDKKGTAHFSLAAFNSDENAGRWVATLFLVYLRCDEVVGHEKLLNGFSADDLYTRFLVMENNPQTATVVTRKGIGSQVTCHRCGAVTLRRYARSTMTCGGCGSAVVNIGTEKKPVWVVRPEHWLSRFVERAGLKVLPAKKMAKDKATTSPPVPTAPALPKAQERPDACKNCRELQSLRDQIAQLKAAKKDVEKDYGELLALDEERAEQLRDANDKLATMRKERAMANEVSVGTDTGELLKRVGDAYEALVRIGPMLYKCWLTDDPIVDTAEVYSAFNKVSRALRPLYLGTKKDDS